MDSYYLHGAGGSQQHFSSGLEATLFAGNFPPAVYGGVAGLSLDIGGVEVAPPAKKKRGRPRKYKPISSINPLNGDSSGSQPSLGSSSSAPKRRGRPPGSGKKQQIASNGKKFNDSAGTGLTPHVLEFSAGEDIASEICSFSQQGPISVCILSARGVVSSVTFRHYEPSGGPITYEGHYEILCLSHSSAHNYDEDGSSSRTGGLCISISGPDGKVFGGSIIGRLIAASPVEVILVSYNYSRSKRKANFRSEQDSVGHCLVKDQDRQGEERHDNIVLPTALATAGGQRLIPPTSR